MKAVNNYKKLYKEERRKVLHLEVQINQMKSEIESLKKYFLAIIEHLEKNDELQRHDNYHDVYNTPANGDSPVNKLENYGRKTRNPQVKSRASNLL